METLVRYAGQSRVEGDHMRLAPNLARRGPEVRVRVLHPLTLRDGLLALRACLQSELYVSPEEIRQRQLDPVVTAGPDGVHFEVFSRDESTYGRLTLRPDGLEGLSETTWGCTNVDLSDALVAGLREIRSFHPLTLSLDRSGIEVARPERAVREAKVELPDAWVRGFLEVQAAQRVPGERLELHPTDLVNLLDYLKRRRARTSPRSLRFAPGSPPSVTVEPWGHVVRLARSRAEGTGEVRVWGRRRLLLLQPLLPLARRVRVLLQGTGRASFWTVDLPGGAFVLGLSPWTAREWTVSDAMTRFSWGPAAEEGVVARVDALLQEHLSLSASEVGTRLGASAKVVDAALDRLCLRGRVLYDMDVDRYLARRLLDEEVPEVAAPSRRQQEAERLVREGRVEIARSGDTWEGTVRGRGGTYAVRLTVAEGACACPFFQRHGMRHGPCKHLLAARLITLG